MNYGTYKKPIALSDMIEQDFDPAEMGPGFKRGLVLKVYKAKIKELVGSMDFSTDLKKAVLLPKEGKGYDNPTLVIYFKAGSLWATELQYQRHKLKILLNQRLKADFIKKVIIK